MTHSGSRYVTTVEGRKNEKNEKERKKHGEKYRKKRE